MKIDPFTKEVLKRCFWGLVGAALMKAVDKIRENLENKSNEE